MSPRTVLHLIHTGGVGGAETVVEQLVRYGDHESWRTVTGVPGEGWLLSALREAAAEVVVLPSSGPFDGAMLFRLIRILKTRRVDVVHTHLFGPAVYGSVAGRIAGLPVVSTIHGSVDLAAAHRWWGMKKRLLRGPGNRFVAVTEGLRAEVIRELGVSPERTRVIANGIDVSRFVPRPSGVLREELGWSSDNFVIGAVGNVRRPKGYDTLLEAAKLLREECPSCRFVVVGDMDGEPALTHDLLARRRALGLDDMVVFAGFRADVVDVLNNFDIYVMSSTREGLPLAVLQAMAVRLPIVATMCGGPQEVLTHDRNALLVAVRDPRALAEAIRHLVDSGETRERLATTAWETVRARYTVERMVEEYERLYVECLGDGRGLRSEVGLS